MHKQTYTEGPTDTDLTLSICPSLGPRNVWANLMYDQGGLPTVLS